MHVTPVLDSREDATRVVEVEPAFVSVKDAGVYIGKIVPREVYRLVERDELVAVRHGRRRMISLESLKAYAKKLLDEAEAERAAKASSTA